MRVGLKVTFWPTLYLWLATRKLLQVSVLGTTLVLKLSRFARLAFPGRAGRPPAQS
jgi:hypothetical protein